MDHCTGPALHQRRHPDLPELGSSGCAESGCLPFRLRSVGFRPVSGPAHTDGLDRAPRPGRCADAPMPPGSSRMPRCGRAPANSPRTPGFSPWAKRRYAVAPPTSCGGAAPPQGRAEPGGNCPPCAARRGHEDARSQGLAVTGPSSATALRAPHLPGWTPDQDPGTPHCLRGSPSRPTSGIGRRLGGLNTPGEGGGVAPRQRRPHRADVQRATLPGARVARRGDADRAAVALTANAD